MFGPFRLGQVPAQHVNGMGGVGGGGVPRGHTPGKWRLIPDLSYPEGGSVNNGIRPELFSLRYTSVEVVAAAAQRLGKGALLAKLDINQHTGLCLCTPATDGCWALNGRVPTT